MPPRPNQLYLGEVERSDIHVGLFGLDYGNEDEEGLSPTERVFARATDMGAQRIVFVKGTDGLRPPKMRTLIRKAMRREGGIVNENNQRTGRGAPFKPVVRRAIDLYQFPYTGVSGAT